MTPKSWTGKKAIIIGAGPAGLTAAHELIKSGILPIILERESQVGGISKTVVYKGNRIDIGGHRFFSKFDRVTNWWLQFLPLENEENRSGRGDASSSPDNVMLLKRRKSSIYYQGELIQYPLSFSVDTIKKFGFIRIARLAASYLRRLLFPIKPEKNLEDFFINRFGEEMYTVFFKSYSEKVWGTPCSKMGTEWGAQRIKGLSFLTVMISLFGQLIPHKRGYNQKGIETSLIEYFLYPKFGPGQLWEAVASSIRHEGGELHENMEVRRIILEGTHLVGVEAISKTTGETQRFDGDYFISTMAVKDLIGALPESVPAAIRTLAVSLPYRDFITVGVLLKNFNLRDKANAWILKDQWIYIQDPAARVGRIQIFNNWSQALVADASLSWIGMEYFCSENDELWKLSDSEMIAFSIKELQLMNFAEPTDVLDHVVIKVPKAYPAYMGAYSQFSRIRSYMDQYDNLFLVGRNGMHRYNNQDHSMLSALIAVKNIRDGRSDKSNIWEVNTDDSYHESKPR